MGVLAAFPEDPSQLDWALRAGAAAGRGSLAVPLSSLPALLYRPSASLTLHVV